MILISHGIILTQHNRRATLYPGDSSLPRRARLRLRQVNLAEQVLRCPTSSLVIFFVSFVNFVVKTGGD